MIKESTAEVWQCTVCEWVWFKRTGKTPKRCPNAKCRKLATYTPPILSASDVATLHAKHYAPAMEEMQANRPGPIERALHNPKTCRVYRCGICTARKADNDAR